MQPLFVTERLVVRPWTVADTDAAFDIYSRNEVNTWLPNSPVRSPEEMRERVESWAEPTNDPTYGFWAITTHDTDHPIGAVMLRPLPHDEDVEIGWHLHPDQWGHGYATEAGRGAARRAFETGIEEVFAVVRPGNERSRAVAQRLGMEYVGRTEKYYGLEMELYRLRPADLLPV